jgi:hypothetical protein
MDRSFLSRKPVIEASRNFVCVRLMTYESKAEGEFLQTLFVGRSGELENSTFAILSPDGREKLTRAGRSPDFAFRGSREEEPADQMARTMNEIAKRYGFVDGNAVKKSKAKAPDGVPAIADVRLGLNVASCDSMPLVIVAGTSAKEAEAVESALTPVAWSDAFRGRFAYVVTHEKEALEKVPGAKASSRIVVVRPDAYGEKADVLAELPAGADEKAIRAAFEKALAEFAPPSKDPRSHIREGRRTGVHWETEIPVTDPGPEGGRPPR